METIIKYDNFDAKVKDNKNVAFSWKLIFLTNNPNFFHGHDANKLKEKITSFISWSYLSDKINKDKTPINYSQIIRNVSCDILDVSNVKPHGDYDNIENFLKIQLSDHSEKFVLIFDVDTLGTSLYRDILSNSITHHNIVKKICSMSKTILCIREYYRYDNYHHDKYCCRLAATDRMIFENRNPPEIKCSDYHNCDKCPIAKVEHQHYHSCIKRLVNAIVTNTDIAD